MPCRSTTTTPTASSRSPCCVSRAWPPSTASSSWQRRGPGTSTWSPNDTRPRWPSPWTPCPTSRRRRRRSTWPLRRGPTPIPRRGPRRRRCRSCPRWPRTRTATGPCGRRSTGPSRPRARRWPRVGPPSRNGPSATWPSSGSTWGIPTRRGRPGPARPCTAPPCTRARRACGWPPWPGAASRSATATSRGSASSTDDPGPGSISAPPRPSSPGPRRPADAGSSTGPGRSPGRCTWRTVPPARSTPRTCSTWWGGASTTLDAGPPAWDPYA